jgi:hypothetical protein
VTSPSNVKEIPMIKRMAFGVLMCALLGGAAFAQTTPAPTDPSPAPPASTNAPAATPEPAAPTVPPVQSEGPTATPGAQAAVETPADCMKLANDLAQSAEEKDLTPDKLEKIDDLLIKMETHCDASQFSDAMTIATDIKAVIETQ